MPKHAETTIPIVGFAGSGDIDAHLILLPIANRSKDPHLMAAAAARFKTVGSGQTIAT